MANARWRFVFVVYALYLTSAVLGSQDLMVKMTKGFTRVVDDCKTELNVGDHIMQDMYNYWREDYQLINRDMGCMLLCMAKKLDLMDDQTMHHGKTEDFAKSHGADDDVAKKLVSVIHECEQQHAGIADDCMRVLEVAKCFRTKIHELKWAPSIEVIMEEVMTAV
ncbi:general odorant-binding protein 1-like [Spodoptera litura]|uniref:General odorant-binding protein 1-like n=2 Tax=Spodoptera litura TaxID=69820 RepID=Q4ZJ97_SPOLT